ncbi:MAG: tRNA-binding protein [Xanthobacteraceae bacterium]|nr:tRNA-binding protein [Xanthobacteraceae bacterium]QYK44429.1 MAG: tRNA-binding protein [Xanthobacteraceae bacterium]
MSQVTVDDFAKVDVRVGTIVEALPFPEAKTPALKLVIDFGGEIGKKNSSAQITKNYSAEKLVGKQVAAVVNFPPRQIGPLKSEVLVLCFPGTNGATLVVPDLKVPDGGKMY